MTTHALRPYQSEMIAGINAAWARGERAVLAVLATGGGKTKVASDVIAATPGAVCAIAHRGELVTQISTALAREGVRHRIIGQTSVARSASAAHMEEFGCDYVSPTSRVAVASVDTLIRMDARDPWFSQVALWFLDEAHHGQRVLTSSFDSQEGFVTTGGNKWGRAIAMFRNARGLGVTATPLRADGRGLGVTDDGVFDSMVLGPTMRDLINMRFLCDYRIINKPSDIDLSAVTTSESGDYSPPKLSAARAKSHITGDVVEHYLKYAPGKRGITFDVDVASATDTAAAFRGAGIAAEVVSAKTPDDLRRSIIRRFRAGEILQLVNVDLFGEGFDLPAIEVVSMARPTQSYGLYCLDPLTEVLTPSGWKGFDEILTIDEVIGFDMNNDSCRPVPVESRVLRAMLPDEKIYRVDGPHLDIAVSDKHDLIVMGRSKTCVNWQKSTAEETSQRRAMYRIPVAAKGCFPGAPLTDHELHLLGWWLSDGTVNKITNGAAIVQSVKKTKHVNLIRESLIGSGIKFTEAIRKRVNCPPEHSDLVYFSFSKGTPRARDKHLRGWSALAPWMNKSLPAAFDLLTREQLLTLLFTWNLGDGLNDHKSLDYVKNTLTITIGKDKRMADRLQALCAQRGLRCNIRLQKTKGDPNGTFRRFDSFIYIAHIRDCMTASLPGTGVKDGKVSGKKSYERTRLVASDERPPFVWCLSNELGTLITRRNGKVAIVGNCQQFGRALRIMDGKQTAILIDHVGNVARHGLPDAPREWSLDRREKRARSGTSDAIPTRTCLNPDFPVGSGVPCASVYERFRKVCPFCGFPVTVTNRSGPEHVDGVLAELDPAVLAAMRGETAAVMQGARMPVGVTPEVRIAIMNRHHAMQTAQIELRRTMALWSGWQQHLGRTLDEQQARFYYRYGVDTESAQAYKKNDALTLRERILEELNRHNVIEATQ